MLGMILAAGEGRRLRPYTHELPKALVPVDGDTTILDVVLRNMARVDIRDVVVVVGYAAGAVEVRKAALESRHGVRLTLVHNDRASDWNNCYSLWLARQYFAEGVLLSNGDTVHPPSVEEALLTQRGAGVLLAVDDEKPLAEEEMKVVLDLAGSPNGLRSEARLARITKQLDPAKAHGEYIGVTVIEPGAAASLADALETTWRRDTGLYYEDGYQELADRGGDVRTASIGAVEWVEVDDHADLARAREIACRC